MTEGRGTTAGSAPLALLDGTSSFPDFIARLADAWDGRGKYVFLASGLEHRALLDLAGLDASLATVRWAELREGERFKLIFAARRAIEFGRQCAWIFGQGQGAR